MNQTCLCKEIENEKVKRGRAHMLPDDKAIDIAEIFKVFGDYTRLKIIYALLEEELCVNDIASITDTSISAVSHQLRILKQANLVKYRRDGKTIYYMLDDNHVKEIFEKGMEHIEEI